MSPWACLIPPSPQLSTRRYAKPILESLHTGNRTISRGPTYHNEQKKKEQTGVGSRKGLFLQTGVAPIGKRCDFLPLWFLSISLLPYLILPALRDSGPKEEEQMTECSSHCAIVILSPFVLSDGTITNVLCRVSRYLIGRICGGA